MQIIQMQLNTSSRPLLNNSYINTRSPNHSAFSMEMNPARTGIIVTHEKHGDFSVPLTSCSWYVPAKIERKANIREIKAKPKAKAKAKATTTVKAHHDVKRV